MLTMTGTQQFGTYLGGSEDELGLGIVLDSGQHAYIFGGTNATNFPTMNTTLQPGYAGATMPSSPRSRPAADTRRASSGTAMMTYDG
jgi:hypothetical protein